MTKSGSALLLASLLVGGCWPYLPGEWEDYTTPEDTRILGRAYLDEYAGGYWSDGDPQGAIWWAWLDQPETSLKAIETAAPIGVGCSTDGPDMDDFVGLFADPGADSSSLTDPNGDEISLPYYAEDAMFSSSVSSLPIGQYTLDALAGDNAGNVKVSTFMRVPAPADIDGVDIDEDSPVTISLSDLDFVWNPADELAQYIIVTVYLANSDDQIIEMGVCASKYVNGDINFSTSMWTQSGSAVGAYVILSTANEQWVEIGQRGIASRILAERRTVGYVHLN